MNKTKIKVEKVFIKILPSSLLDNLFFQTWHNHEAGDIVEVIKITEEMMERARERGHSDLGEGYLINGYGFIAKALTTTDITDDDYNKYMDKLGKEIDKKEAEKDIIDKAIAAMKLEYENLAVQKVALNKK